DAGTRYVVMPMSGRALPTLVKPRALPVRDDAVERFLLRPRVIQVVVDDVVAEGRPDDRPRLEGRDCFAQRGRESLDRRLVRVSLERRQQLQLVLDPVEP